MNQLDPIHTWFGLSYSSYLVLPRTALQSMPDDWQARLVALLDEADVALGEIPTAGRYYVSLRDERGRTMRDPLRDYERGRRKVPLRPHMHDWQPTTWTTMEGETFACAGCKCKTRNPRERQ